MIYVIHVHPSSLHVSIQIIITKRDFRGQYVKLIQF